MLEYSTDAGDIEAPVEATTYTSVEKDELIELTTKHIEEDIEHIIEITTESFDEHIVETGSTTEPTWIEDDAITTERFEEIEGNTETTKEDIEGSTGLTTEILAEDNLFERTAEIFQGSTNAIEEYTISAEKSTEENTPTGRRISKPDGYYFL